MIERLREWIKNQVVFCSAQKKTDDELVEFIVNIINDENRPLLGEKGLIEGWDKIQIPYEGIGRKVLDVPIPKAFAKCGVPLIDCVSYAQAIAQVMTQLLGEREELSEVD